MKIQHLYIRLKYLMLVLLAVGAVSCADEEIVSGGTGEAKPQNR